MKVALPDMTVLERQLATLLKWQEAQGTDLFQQQARSQSFFSSMLSGGGGSSSSLSLGSENLMGLGDVVDQFKMTDPSPGIEYWDRLGKIELPCLGFSGGIGTASSSGYEVSCGSISRTASCPPTVPVAAACGQLVVTAVATDKVGASAGKDSFRKRKLERVQSPKGYEEETRDKKIKGCSDDTESKISELSNNNNDGNKKNIKRSNNNKKETSASSSKDNSKTSEVQKPDYIHVRARRGQATDSHSLAERARREKISERMKFLQDLVPGCNKVTGKAGMLDEIINYVQSLQQQVEFLSMKLAMVNPRLDFDIDSIFSKEMIPACTSSFPMIDMSLELTNPAYLHFDPMQQVVSCSGLDMGITDPDIGLRRTISALVPIPEPFIEPSCFAQVHPTASWHMDFQNLYDMESQQGRSTAATYQSHHQQCIGPIEAANMKIEI